MRYNELTALQRDQRNQQERANVSMWRVSQRVPDNTDSPGVYATAAATEATPSSTEVTNRAGEPHLPVASANPVVGGEDGEEQRLEEDLEMQNADPE